MKTLLSILLLTVAAACQTATYRIVVDTQNVGTTGQLAWHCERGGVTVLSGDNYFPVGAPKNDQRDFLKRMLEKCKADNETTVMELRDGNEPPLGHQHDAGADLTGTLAAARMPALTGDVTSSAGSVVTTLANSGASAGSYDSVTVDAKGRVTAGTSSNAVDLTTQGAAIAATTITTPGAAGQWMVCYNAKVTRAATTSSTLGPFQIKYTDNDDSTTPSVPSTAVTGVNQATGNSTTTAVSGCYLANVKASTALQYVMGYTSSGATTMQYELHIRARKLN